MEKQTVKILAPASSPRGVYDVLKSGADAVYVGVKGWSLRPPLFEITKEELKECVEITHSLQKLIYLPINCFYRSDEINTLLKEVEHYADWGVDTLVISDIGTIEIIKQHFPQFYIVASLQCNIVNREDVKFYKKAGINELVITRNFIDLSAANIRSLSEDIDVGIEIFVFGDNSQFFDGKCYLSSYINQKTIKDDTSRHVCYVGNANRSGYCFLMCKRDWRMEDDNKEIQEGRIFRKTDICLGEELPDLIKAGVTTLKIQGREYPHSYICKIVQSYREIIDNIKKEMTIPSKELKILQSCKNAREAMLDSHLVFIKRNKSKFWKTMAKYFEKPIDSLLSFIYLTRMNRTRNLKTK